MILLFEFTVGTGYVGSIVTDEVEVEVDDEATDEEIETAAEEAWADWKSNIVEGGYKRL